MVTLSVSIGALFVAFVCFALAAFGLTTSRIALVPAGLALLTFGLLLEHYA